MNIIIIPIIVVFLDQVTKLYIKYSFKIYETKTIINHFVNIYYIENKGIAFGIDTSRFHFLITIFTIIAIIIIFYYLFLLVKENSVEKYPISLICGGAIGNCIDRILVMFPATGYQGVIDFIDIGFWNYRWYVFNVADASITCGILFYFFIFYKNKYIDKLNDEGNKK